MFKDKKGCPHFDDCPSPTYQLCTCNMLGEEICVVNWQIARQEGRERWWHFTAKFTLWFFDPPSIKKCLKRAGG